MLNDDDDNFNNFIVKIRLYEMNNYQFEILSHGGGLRKLPANQVLYKGDNRGNVNILFSLARKYVWYYDTFTHLVGIHDHKNNS